MPTGLKAHCIFGASASLSMTWDSDRTRVDQSDSDSEMPVHGFACRPEGYEGEQSTISLRLPSLDGKPIPSSPMSRVLRRDTDEDTAAVLTEFVIPAISVKMIDVPELLESLVEHAEHDEDRSAELHHRTWDHLLCCSFASGFASDGGSPCGADVITRCIW